MGISKPSQKYIKLAVYALVVILLNIAGVTLYKRLDLTQNQIYSLSPASQKVVATLTEPLTIKVFFNQNLPAPYNQTERYLRDLLEAYNQHANTFFNYQFYNVGADDGANNQTVMDNQKMARDYGISPVQIQHVDEDEVKFKSAYMGLVIIHGDVVERIPAISTPDGLEYKLTTAVQKLNNKTSALLSLKEKVQVTLYLSSNLLPVAPFMGLEDLTQYRAALKQAVEKVSTKNYQALTYTYVDPVTLGDQKTITDRHRIMALEWPAVPQKKIAPGKGLLGMVMTYGDRAIEIPLLSVLRIPIIGTQYQLLELERMETMLNEYVETLLEINEDIGYLADHGTLPLGGGMPMQRPQQGALTRFTQMVSGSYTLKPLKLKEASLPDSLNCLVIARPTEEFSDWALYQIDQFLMKGKNIAIFMDAFKEGRPAPQAFGMAPPSNFEPVNTGLERLLAHYGVTLEPSVIMDKECYRQVQPPERGGGEQKLYFAPIIKSNNIDQSLPFTRNLKGLITMKMSPLTVDHTLLEKHQLTGQRVFASSDQAWEMRDTINLNPMMIFPPSAPEEYAQHDLAWLIQGGFPSYFDGKPLPEKPAAEKKADDPAISETDTAAADQAPPPELAAKVQTQGNFIAKGQPGKIFIVGSADLLQDMLMDPEGRSPNAMLVMNLLDHFNQRDDTAAMRSKIQTYNPLVQTSSFAKNMIKGVNIAGMPLAVVLFGLFMWLRRNRRKRQIQLLFNGSAAS